MGDFSLTEGYFMLIKLLLLILPRHPYQNIGGYMLRQWLMPRWALTYNNATQRLEPKCWVPIAFRLNTILRPDADPYLHDHPWDWTTHILAGWYIEEDANGTYHHRNAGETVSRKAHEPHRIAAVSDTGVTTLFITRRPYNHWGFYVGNPARKIPHEQYHSPNNRASQVYATGIKSHVEKWARSTGNTNYIYITHSEQLKGLRGGKFYVIGDGHVDYPYLTGIAITQGMEVHYA
jgi:hypothetical protein